MKRLVIVLILTAYPFGARAEDAPKKTWSQKMQAIRESFQEMLIDLNSDERFNAPSNFKRIEKNAENISKLAHQLKSKEGPPPDSDPALQILAGQFAREASHAHRTLKWGHRAYARDILRSLTGYCIACHTRKDSTDLSIIGSLPPEPPLKNLERSDFFAATRQFDRALVEYEKIVADLSNIEKRPYDWERAVRSGLAIAIRVKKDPDKSLSFVNRVLDTPSAPFYLREQAAQWKKSIESWKAENVASPKNEEEYYIRATVLVGEAKSVQKYPADRSADVVYLRASSAVHDLLSQYPNGTRTADALYLAGLCYEVLRDLNLWDQHEFYYLACITKAPHTERSRECFNHYEQAIYEGYTGSGGTAIPAEIREKLKQLGALSKPLDDRLMLQ